MQALSGTGEGWHRLMLQEKGWCCGAVASPEPAAASRGVETGDVGMAIVVDKMLVRAQKKFDQLDARWQWCYWRERSLLELAEWVWSSFHPGGDALSEEQKAA